MKKFVLLVVLAVAVNSLTFGQQQILHIVTAIIKIDSQIIRVEDGILLPRLNYANNPDLKFSLGKNFKLVKDYQEFKIVDLGENDEKTNLYSIVYKTHRPDGDLTFNIKYEAKIEGELVQNPAEYARGFSETDGIICSKGIYLAGSTHWIADFEHQKFIFSLNALLDKRWPVVSQGNFIKLDSNLGIWTTRIDCNDPMEEIYLISGPWTYYEQPVGPAIGMAYLRTPDEKLAFKYFDATRKYIEIYNQMIGPYPYQKFALVENFWETGYGMPSFTLLGEKIIRFPWIINSSYPHELLHNWWGNSVYVGQGGNWCEGITSYMADHMIKETVGEGADYRRSTLEKFTDYVNAENDFPLNKFISRNNPAEEAIGYGKCLMMNHMLRLMVGDQIFKSSYNDFYMQKKFTEATFTDIKDAFERNTGMNLNWYFDQWVNRTGAPKLEISNVLSVYSKKKYTLSFSLNQIQVSDPFIINVPVAIFYEGDSMPEMKNFTMKEKSFLYTQTTDKKPLKIVVDPMFDVFRTLDNREVPAAISRLLGSQKILFILPHDPLYPEVYEKLTKEWPQYLKNVTIVKDNDLYITSEFDAVIVIGGNNESAKILKPDAELKKYLTITESANWDTAFRYGALFYTQTNPLKPDQTFGFVEITDTNMVSPFLRKIPHYGKYSFLGFKNKTVDNILKGSFIVTDSPLHYTIKYKKPSPEVVERYPERKPLSSF